MEDEREIARASWKDAQKIRAEILGSIQSLKRERGNINYTSRFEEVEQTMAQFRLTCINVIDHDFAYANDKKVETSLWQAHTFLNGEYRKVLGRLQAQNQVVQRRKLDKLYRNFLKVSQSFYRVYIQQLSGRFYIPELRQVACGTELEPAEPLPVKPSPPAPLRAIILKSCRTTLVHLGDLARYRCQSSDKVSKATFDKALDYYGLANILDPEDGMAHHQMAVLYQPQGQHLDIVYHFHRAISVTKPHELGLGNLEREFRGLDTASATKKAPIKDQSEAMVTWFVRLHAFFFQGEQFSQQSELEEEVLHRIEIAMKSDGSETTLCKMILVNIAAYDIATEQVKTSWTIKGSQFCQFVLRFNVRTILILLRLLKNALQEEPLVVPGSDYGDNDGECIGTFGLYFMKLLPLLRIYISWIYVCRADFAQYQEYLEPYVRDVYRLLADTLASLNTYIDPAMSISPSRYLLPEDTEALGLRPLGDRRLPLFSQVQVVQGSTLPKKLKVRKPRKIVFGRQFKPQTETIWRIRDIVYCGVLLAGSAKFPLALTIKEQDRRETESWDFTGDAAAQVCNDELGMSRLLSKLNLSESKAVPEKPPRKNANISPVEMSSTGLSQPSISGYGDLAPGASTSAGKGKSLEEPPAPFMDTDLSEDSEMINMVNKLLDPVEDVHPPSSQDKQETSYGMNSATANEVFGRLAVSPKQPSPVSKTIPNLPWDYFYTPTPHRSTSQGQNQLKADGDYVPRSAAAQFNAFDSSPYLNNLGTPFQQSFREGSSKSPAQGHLDMGVGMSYKPPGPPQGKSSAGGLRSNGAFDSLEMSRSAVLDSLKSALYAQHGFAPPNAQAAASLYNRVNGSPLQPQRTSPGTSGSSFFPGTGSPIMADNRNNIETNYMQRPTSQHAAKDNIPSPLGPPGKGRPTGKHAAFPSWGSQFPKISSPTTSNNFDLPQPASKRLSKTSARDVSSGPFQQQYSPWLPEPPASGSSFAFSHPSSLYGGTPATVAAAAGAPSPAGPAHAVACNGNFFNASTPFGRLGEGESIRDDPTHFRNQLRAATGNAELSYDQQILQAAMMDHSSNKRGGK